MFIEFCSKDMYGEEISDRYNAEKKYICGKTVYEYRDSISQNKVIFDEESVEIHRNGETTGIIQIFNSEIGKFEYVTPFFKKIFSTKCEYINKLKEGLKFKYAVCDGDEVMNVIEISIGEGV